VVPVYLSDAWIAALDAAARSHPGLADATAGVRVVIEQVVTDSGGDGGGDDGDGGSSTDAGRSDEVRWHVVVDDGSVRFVPGPAADPTVRFTADAATARAITDGRLSSAEAFMAGRLRVGGDTTALVRHHALFDELGDVFAAVDVD
jgi:predicted lipid carrier protein YhbT